MVVCYRSWRKLSHSQWTVSTSSPSHSFVTLLHLDFCLHHSFTRCCRRSSCPWYHHRPWTWKSSCPEVLCTWPGILERQDQGSRPVYKILSCKWPPGTGCIFRTLSVGTNPRFLLEAHGRNEPDQGSLQRLKDGFILKLNLEEWPGSFFLFQNRSRDKRTGLLCVFAGKIKNNGCPRIQEGFSWGRAQVFGAGLRSKRARSWTAWDTGWPVGCVVPSGWSDLLGICQSKLVYDRHVCAQLCLTLCNTMDCSPLGSSLSTELSRQEYGVGCHFLLQEIIPTHGLNPCLPHLLHWQMDFFYHCEFANQNLSLIQKYKTPYWNVVWGVLTNSWEKKRS